MAVARICWNQMFRYSHHRQISTFDCFLWWQVCGSNVNKYINISSYHMTWVQLKMKISSIFHPKYVYKLCSNGIPLYINAHYVWIKSEIFVNILLYQLVTVVSMTWRPFLSTFSYFVSMSNGKYPNLLQLALLKLKLSIENRIQNPVFTYVDATGTVALLLA